MFSLQVDQDLELGLLERRHALSLWALIEQNRSYLREWLPWIDHLNSLTDLEDFVGQALRRFSEDATPLTGIYLRGELVGTVWLHDLDRYMRKAAMGYWLSEAYQRLLRPVPVAHTVRWSRG